MKSYLSIIALIIVSLFISSGFATSSDNIAIGDKAPEITLSGDSCSFSLKEAAGSMILVTFWSVSDAKSRRDCNVYAAASSRAGIPHIAISLDNNSTIYNEVVKTDNLSSSHLFSPDEYTAANLANTYGLHENYGSVLISPDGTILAFNPSVDSLN